MVVILMILQNTTTFYYNSRYPGYCDSRQVSGNSRRLLLQFTTGIAIHDIRAVLTLLS